MAEDDIWDSWEDFADSNELDQHVDQCLRLSNGDLNEENEIKREILTRQDKGHGEESNNSCENGSRNRGAQFRILQRPVVHEDDQNRTAYTPQVKILQRPGKESQNNAERDKEKLRSQPSRTLAEREAAYAEARKRIMGPAAQGIPSSSTNTKSRSEHRKTRGNKSGENVQNNAVTVERVPKGPDKSKGFSTPR